MGQQIWLFVQGHLVVILEIVKNLIAAAVVLIIGILLSKGMRKLISKASSNKLPVEGSVTHLLRAFVHYGILIICLIMILNIFGVNTTSLLAVLGAAGVAVGLALRDVLGNVASGIVLMVLGSYRVGEFVEFSSFSGIVREINLFTTILETYDGVYISAPNSSVWGGPLKNYTRNGKRRIELSIGIAYSDSVETAFQVMQNIVADDPRFLKDPAPQIILHSIETNSVKITVRVWTVVDDYWSAHWDLSKNMKAKCEEAGLRIPLPQQEVRIVQ